MCSSMKGRISHLGEALLLLGLCFITLAGGAPVSSEEPYITLARCRIQCIKKFLPNKDHQADHYCRDTNNYRKNYNGNCSECWDICLKITSTNYMCLSPPKSIGEQTACNFDNKKPAVHPAEGEWKFDNKQVKSDPDNFELNLKWSPPYFVTSSGKEEVTDPGPIVYMLMMRSSNDYNEEWRSIDQVLSHYARIAINDVPRLPEVWIMAVSENGIIAETKHKPTGFISTVIGDPFGEKLDALKAGEFESDWYIEKAKDIQANISIERKLVKGPEGSYQIQTMPLTFRVLDTLDPKIMYYYTIRWYFINCDSAYPDLQDCTMPRENFGSTAMTRGSEMGNYVIENLYFNSLYKLVIYMHADERVRIDIAFRTERCYFVDHLRMTNCLDEIEEDLRPAAPIIGENIQPDDVERPSLHMNITSMVLDSDSDDVTVNVTWLPIANQSYNVTTHMEGDRGMSVDVFVTTNPFVVLKLPKNMQYTVKVDAKILPGDGANAILTDVIQFNTSELPSYQDPMAYKVLNEDDISQLNGIIIGVTCFIIIMVLASLAAILYKKRKSFKDIIVTKATVAKSNSYKSNVGGKSDYSNQLIVFSDEWELDPQKLKFSTLLGQGAFGKVVTGYYDDQKVAIKLVREGAPVSYKEDLVAEIHLMKRIGNHPNIVCLIGATTLTEPIALVMEYVPYGNLQNFLKKCRLEGDLRKRTDGTSEITYAMVQDCGEIENGVVTPADMLSFARQVSMAMEYLSEKKYVHRDLAARNVLIHYNKVVKVCDFGLSRDIFNDNHYKKLTNGKLPLKWMAIESLRDRIFTTQSDVWSFGILLWEIVTMGASPYPNVALADLYFVLSTGYRMDKPSNCSDELYAIMRSCWEDEATDRPTFTQLRFMLEELLAEDRDYLVLEDIDVPITNSDNSSTPSPQSLSGETEGAVAVNMPYPMSNGDLSQVSPPGSPSHPIKIAKKAAPRRDHMRINVCIHQKSTDRLIRPSESDSSPSSC